MCTEASLENLIPPARLPAVEVVARDDIRAALRVCAQSYPRQQQKQTRNPSQVSLTFVSRTVARVIAALDARARAGGFDELDVVVVAEALAALRVAFAANAAGRVVLAAGVVRVQAAQLLRANAAGHWTRGCRVNGWGRDME